MYFLFFIFIVEESVFSWGLFACFIFILIGIGIGIGIIYTHIF